MAGDSLPPYEGAHLPEITDQVAERLFRSLELMEADYQRTLAAECTPPLEPLGELNESEDEVDGFGGYQALGSDGGSSDDENKEADWGGWQVGEAASAPTEGYPPDCQDAWPQTVDAEGLEAFADFGASNPALPAPPDMRLLEAKLLTDDEVKLIKQTMQQIQLPTPAWAANLSDARFQRIVKDSIRSCGP
ncbi:unnamed protein product [Effrenium voratum]|nr:unnamed protein product [Effrenium voratum]